MRSWHPQRRRRGLWKSKQWTTCSSGPSGKKPSYTTVCGTNIALCLQPNVSAKFIRSSISKIRPKKNNLCETSSQLSSEITTPLRGHARFQGVRNQGVYPRHLNWHFCIPFDHAKTARGLHGCGLWGLAHHRGHHFLPMGLKGLKWSESSSRHRDVYVCLMFTQR